MKLWTDFQNSGPVWQPPRRAHELLLNGLRTDFGLCCSEEDLLHGPLGCPFLKGHPDVFVSLSHGDGCAAAAVSWKPVGVDVERVRPFRWSAARHALTPAEIRQVRESSEPDRTFFRLWTLKESFLKVCGQGLSFGMRKAEFDLSVPGEVQCVLEGYRFLLLEDDHPFVTAVCLQDELGG